VKPTSGGGIYPGLVCANFCSSVAIEALEKNNFSSQLLKNYHKLFTKEIGRELKMGMKFRSIFKRLSDKQFDKYITRFQNPKIVEIINNYGDIDYPSILVKHLIKKIPTLLKLLPQTIKK
jgi:flavin-dependent dehydrogenase